MPSENIENITTPPEVEAPKGFRVEIKKSESEIIKAIRKCKSGIVAEQSSDDNLINHIEVALQSGKEDFDLSAKLTILTKGEDKDKEPVLLAWAAEDIVPALKQSYPGIKRINRGFELEGPSGTKLIISSNGDLKGSYFEISTGTIQEAGKDPKQVFSGPKKTRRINNPDGQDIDLVVIKPALQDFKGVLKTCVEKIYGLKGEKPPDGELVFHPPIERIKEEPVLPPPAKQTNGTDGHKKIRFGKTIRPTIREKIV